MSWDDVIDHCDKSFWAFLCINGQIDGEIEKQSNICLKVFIKLS